MSRLGALLALMAGGAFCLSGGMMIEIWRKDIVLQTDEGDIRLSFSPAQPRGYQKLSSALASLERLRKEASQLARGDRELAGAFIVDGEYRCLTELRDAIREALTPGEWAKIEPVADYIDIRGMAEIASSILVSYGEYYRHRLSDGLEE